jgi:hypothetical protein
VIAKHPKESFPFALNRYTGTTAQKEHTMKASIKNMKVTQVNLLRRNDNNVPCALKYFGYADMPAVEGLVSCETEGRNHGKIGIEWLDEPALRDVDGVTLTPSVFLSLTNVTIWRSTAEDGPPSVTGKDIVPVYTIALEGDTALSVSQKNTVLRPLPEHMLNPVAAPVAESDASVEASV